MWLSGAVHVLAPLALFLAPQFWPWAVGSLIANHALLSTVGMLPRSTWLGPNLRRLPGLGGNAVALTFDDGPDPQVTPQVLDLLQAADASASFFVIGSQAERHPQLVREIVARGHRVENHTYRHSPAFAFSLWRGLGLEVDRAQRLIGRLAGRAPRYFRAPAGIRNPFLEPVLARRGLVLASWTRRGYDAVDGDPDRVGRRLLRNLAAGDVLLLHDGSAARDREGEPAVLQVLPKVLQALDARGLRGVALPQPDDLRFGA